MREEIVVLVLLSAVILATPGLAHLGRLQEDYGADEPFDAESARYDEFHEYQLPRRDEYYYPDKFETGDAGPSIPTGRFSDNEEEKVQSSMMTTFEKFKRQAVKTVVPGDEPGGFGLRGGLTWQTATVLSVVCVGAAILGTALGVAYWPRLSRSTESEEKTADAGVTEGVGDRSLAQSAQMYHYQQQKQQMLAMDEASSRIRNLDSNSDTEGECEEPDKNVYECPGLATASEHEVKNPLYQDEHGIDSGASTESGLKH